VTIRRLLFWLHLTVGICVGVVVAFLALTGCILAFQQQAIAWAERGAQIGSPLPNSSCVPPSTLLMNASDAAHASPTAVTFFSDPHQPAQIVFGRDRLLLADACRGSVIGTGAGKLRVFFADVRDLHRWAALERDGHETLRSIKNAGSLAFGFLILSGLVLWLPRRLTKHHVRSAIVPRWKLRGRAREWNWHNVFGFWMAVPLLVIVTTGAIMSYPWANTILYKIAGSQPPTRNEADGKTAKPLARDKWASLDASIARAKAEDPKWHSLLLRMPAEKESKLNFTVDEGSGGRPQLRSQLVIDRKEGKVLRRETFDSTPRGRQWRLIARYLHTGEIFGLIGDMVAFLAAASAFLLVWTGFSLTARRWKSWRANRHKRPETKEKLLAEVQLQ